jgi:hypothetical protein
VDDGLVPHSGQTQYSGKSEHSSDDKESDDDASEDDGMDYESPLGLPNSDDPSGSKISSQPSCHYHQCGASPDDLELVEHWA